MPILTDEKNNNLTIPYDKTSQLIKIKKNLSQSVEEHLQNPYPWIYLMLNNNSFSLRSKVIQGYSLSLILFRNTGESTQCNTRKRRHKDWKRIKQNIKDLL